MFGKRVNCNIYNIKTKTKTNETIAHPLRVKIYLTFCFDQFNGQPDSRNLGAGDVVVVAGDDFDASLSQIAMRERTAISRAKFAGGDAEGWIRWIRSVGRADGRACVCVYVLQRGVYHALARARAF
jgi:hypothetical protein